MNLKSKFLLAVSLVSLGMSAVNASEGLPENPEDRTITQELQVAIASGDSARVKELAGALEVFAEAQKMLQDIGAEWDVLKAEMQTAGVASGVNADMQRFRLPDFDKIDTFRRGIVDIIPAALAMPGGAVPPSTEDLKKLTSKVDRLNNALDGFGERMQIAIQANDAKNSSEKPMTIGQRVQARLAAQGSPTERTSKACIALGYSDGIAGMFVKEFDENKTHRYDWRTISDNELCMLINNYMDNGYITRKKPLAFPSDTAYERASQKTGSDTARPISFERARKVCRNPNVPDYFLRIAVDSIMRESKKMTDEELVWAINDAL
jgi:hypothetical protein